MYRYRNRYYKFAYNWFSPDPIEKFMAIFLLTLSGLFVIAVLWVIWLFLRNL